MISRLLPTMRLQVQFTRLVAQLKTRSAVAAAETGGVESGGADADGTAPSTSRS